MNGHELIYALNKLSFEELNLPVETDGCDCNGRAIGVSVADSFEEEPPYKQIKVILVERAHL